MEGRRKADAGVVVKKFLVFVILVYMLVLYATRFVSFDIARRVMAFNAIKVSHCEDTLPHIGASLDESNRYGQNGSIYRRQNGHTTYTACKVD